MEHRALGSTGVIVPVVGMGTWQTFDVRRERDIQERSHVTDAAIHAGATLFDTSPMYGRSPEVLASTIGVRRKDVIVADKIWTTDAREGRTQAARAIERFQGMVDIYQIHNLAAWKTQLALLEEMRDRGTVRVIGATHYAHSAFPELLRVMRTGRIGQIQIPYNVADRVVEKEILPAAADLGIGVLVMRPLAEGALMRRAPDAKKLEPLKPFGVETWAQALLKWILSDSRVHCVIPATTHPERMRENAGAGSAPWFDDETRRYVGRLIGEQQDAASVREQ
jgi:aryl-alcohol dehydrogenase-like predicted oxidoreductase